MTNPEKVLITAGHEVGGLTAFAEGLSEGFTALGIPSEVISPNEIFKRWRDLRDAKVLKILSTTAVFAAPFARRAICMAHCLPRADTQGWRKTLAIFASFRLANAYSGTQLVAVSDYVAIHLQTIFNLRINAVIRNPLRSIFLERPDVSDQNRCYITYAGRLTPVKNLHSILPAICDLLDETPGLRLCIIGDGEQRAALERYVNGNLHVEFKGKQDPHSVREWLRRTKVFVSGNPTEGLGITYLEALSQGCVVAMPACGGGIEIDLGELGKSVHLLPLSLDRGEVTAVLHRALDSTITPVSLSAYEAKAVAKAYLRVDAGFYPIDKCARYKMHQAKDEIA
jgi:glycosyltransferase involved in cell wall biosynthesis